MDNTGDFGVERRKRTPTRGLRCLKIRKRSLETIQMMAESSCGLSPKVVREIVFNLREANHIEYRFINKMCGRPPQYAPSS